MFLVSCRAYEKAEDGVHYCEERFLDVARRYGVLGLPARHVPLEEALKAHASQARIRALASLLTGCCRAGRAVPCFGLVLGCLL